MSRSLMDIVVDVNRLHDQLMEMMDVNMPFSSVKSDEIFAEYDVLKVEFMRAYHSARRRGIDLRGLPMPFGYVGPVQ
jgi:hypothetical protein